MSAIRELIEYEQDGNYVLADAATNELEEYRALLKRCLPFVEDMIGIASEARFLKAEIEAFLSEVS